VSALIELGTEHDVLFPVIRGAITTNTAIPEKVVDGLVANLGDLKGKTIAVWGLAFKPNTDDLREAPSLKIIQKLIALGATVRAHDPIVTPKMQADLPEGMHHHEDMYTCCADADALFIATEWDEYRAADLTVIRNLLTQPYIFDGRNIFDPSEMNSRGFRYKSIGR